MGKFTDLMQAALYGTPMDLLKKPDKQTFMDIAVELDGDLADGVIIGSGIALATGGNGARVYINSTGTYMVDSANVFPAVHYIDVNGSVVIDLSAINIYETYVFAFNDFAATSGIIDSGFGHTIVGSAERDGFTASQAIQMRGGESIAIVRITGNAYVILGGMGNPDILRVIGATDLRMYEQPDGRYDVYFEKSVPTGTQNIDVVVAGKTIDFTNAICPENPRVREDNATARTVVKLRTLGNNGTGGGRVTVENTNATTLTIAVFIKDAEVTV